MATATVRPLRELHISPNFQLAELACKCCRTLLVSDLLGELIDCLQRFRDAVGKPVRITSAYRCPKHNAEVGGKLNSWHMQAGAADIQVAGMTPAQLAPIAKRVGFKEVIPEGQGAGAWLHVAVRD